MRRFVSSVAVVAATLAGFAHPAEASTPKTAVGTFTFLSDTLTPFRSAGGNTFFNEVASLSYAGDLTGIASDTDTFVMHRDGSFFGQGTEACTSCMIGGRMGDFTAVFVFTGSGAQYAGTLTFTGGSGGLAGLHGSGTFASNNTYSYNYHFDP